MNKKLITNSINILTFCIVGIILGIMHYDFTTWQFWVICLCMMINKISAMIYTDLERE